MRRVIMGAWPAGVGSGFGLRVSQPGKDAVSADNRDLTFSSDWPAVLPLLQSGSFNISGNQQLTVAFPDPGYIPFCFFMTNAGPPQSGYAPVIPTNVWAAYQATYQGEGSNSYLRLCAQRGNINAYFSLYLPNGGSQGYPNSFYVAYAIYRLPAQ